MARFCGAGTTCLPTKHKQDASLPLPAGRLEATLRRLVAGAFEGHANLPDDVRVEELAPAGAFAPLEQLADTTTPTDGGPAVSRARLSALAQYAVACVADRIALRQQQQQQGESGGVAARVAADVRACGAAPQQPQQPQQPQADACARLAERHGARSEGCIQFAMASSTRRLEATQTFGSSAAAEALLTLDLGACDPRFSPIVAAVFVHYCYAAACAADAAEVARMQLRLDALVAAFA